MKILKKLFYRLCFNIMFFQKKRYKNSLIDNSANLLVLNPNIDLIAEEIPKKIWMYWEGETSPLVERCMQRVKDFHPDYEVNILNPINVTEYCNIDFGSHIFKQATPQQRADLIRFDLIYHHGGIWLDASTIIYENFEWIIQLVKNKNTQSFTYYRSKNTTQLKFPVIENWLLASVKNNIFYKHWFDELYFAIQIGPKQYIQQLKMTQTNYQELFQEIGRLEYLVAYVACQKIMRQFPPSIVLIDCDQNAFFYQVKNNWIKEKVSIDIALNFAPDEKPKLIKLAGKERKILNTYFSKNKYLEGSLLDI